MNQRTLRELCNLARSNWGLRPIPANPLAKKQLYPPSPLFKIPTTLAPPINPELMPQGRKALPILSRSYFSDILSLVIQRINKELAHLSSC